MASASMLIVLACLFTVNTKCSSLGPDVPSALPPVHEADAPFPQTSPPITGLMCISPCLMRCKSYDSVCISACYKCCNLCRCVPFGPMDNKDECGICYTGKVTASGKPKCP